jgi:hypothetical protein
MNFSRKTILVVGAALLAACGDKVTVQEYTPPTTAPKVNSVEVSPASVTLNVGQSVTFTAAVNADAGLATTVTWTASAGTITSAGVFTAPATGNPGIAVCATSTVDTGKKGCAQVVVTAPTATIPATVSINSITAGALNTPVVTNAVVGQMDVTLNVNPGNQTVSKIVLTVGGIRTDSQVFTAAQSAAMRFAADEAVAAQSTFPQVVFSVNTAAFNATTGVPRWFNATQGVSAQLYTTQGGATAAASATAQTNLTFANPNNVTGSISVTGGNSTTDANGYAWKSGKLSASVIPVIYSVGKTTAAVVVNFGTGVCDNSGAGARSKAAAAAGSSWTVEFGNTGGSATDNVSAFEFGPALCAANYTAGGQSATVDIVDSDGAPLVIGAALGRVRLDNLAPAAPVFAANPNARTAGWINPDVTLTTQGATNLNGWLVATPVDLGVGSGGAQFKIGADQATAIASTTFYTSTASLSPTLDAVAQCAVLYGKDKLGNTSADPAAAACTAGGVGGTTQATYGFDNSAPSVTALGAPGTTSSTSTSRRTGANLAGDFVATVADIGTVGNSGMAAVNPVKATVKLRNVAAAATCVIGDPATLATTCDPANITNNAAAISALGGPGFVSAVGAGQVGINVNAAAVNGYYTASVWAVDAAGNVSAVRTRVTVLDNVAPSVTTASLTSAGNANAGFSFTSLASDNLDLQNYRYYTQYTTAGPILMFPADAVYGTPVSPNVNWRETLSRTAINGYNAATFINSNFQMPGSSNAPLTLQGSTAGVWPASTPAAWAATDKIQNIVSEVRDQGSVTLSTITGVAGSIVAPAATPFTTATSPSTDITDFSFAMLNIGSSSTYGLRTFTACSGAETRDQGTTAGCQAVSLPAVPEASSRSIRVQVQGATGALLQPFAKVYIIGLDAQTATASLVKLGELTSVALTDNGITRFWRYDGTLTMDANTFDMLGGVTVAFGGAGTITRNIFVVGVDANGRVGLVSQPIQITIKA